MEGICSVFGNGITDTVIYTVKAVGNINRKLIPNKLQERKLTQDKAAIISDKITITYGELACVCNNLGAILSKGKLVLIRCGMDAPTIIGYAAAIHSGATVMMCEDKAFDNCFIENYRPSYIWQSNKNIPSGYSTVYSEYGYVLLCADNEVRYEINEELALLLSTSGSTGSSKFVRISHKNIVDNTRAIVKALGIKAHDRAMVMLPISYTYGLSVVNTYLSVRATLLVPDYPVYHAEFWRFARKYSCSAICGVPYTYELIRRGGFLKKPIESLRLATQAGGKLSADTEKYMLDMADKRKFDFAVMYGQTEATARISCHILNRHPDKLGSAGQAIPGGNISVEDGELIYKGNNVTMGYSENCWDLAKGDERGGVLHTGDLGYIDEDGFVYITGRKSRISKLNGYRISLDELEALIKSQFSVTAACVERTDGIHIVIEAQLGGQPVIEDIRSYVIQKTGINGRLINLSQTGLLPRAENGKILYSRIDSTSRSR